MQTNIWNAACVKEELVLSLRPEWFDAICSGQKRYEYRRSYRTDATLAYVYVTVPTAAVCGRLDLAPPIIAAPREIARIAESQRPGNGTSVLRYLGEREVGYAVPVIGVEVCSPIPLKALRDAQPKFAPPQSYLLLKNYPVLADVLRQAFPSLPPR